MGGDVSVSPGPFVAKWGPRIGEPAARLRWAANWLVGLGGLAGPLWIIPLAVGASSGNHWITVLGFTLCFLDFIVVGTGAVMFYRSCREMSRFLGVKVTMRNAPDLRDDRFQKWYLKHVGSQPSP
jgi:hypothetical protein